ncbi:MAG: hypothetical protein FT671_00830 [Pantoea sp. Brub]|nr:hypothetical protein [Pantoea sp. Brub]
MSITANLLYREAKNFFQNRILIFIIISLLTSVVTMLLYYIFALPISEKIIIFNKQQLKDSSLFEIIKNMSMQDKSLMLRFFIINTSIELINCSILYSIILNLIPVVVSKKNFLSFYNINQCILSFPKMFLLNFLANILIQLGFIILFIPGILFTILFSMSPIFLVNDKSGIIKSLINSNFLVFKNIKLIIPVIIISLISKIILLLFFTISIHIPSYITLLLFTTLNNLISSFLIVYLYRLYMLLY